MVKVLAVAVNESLFAGSTIDVTAPDATVKLSTRADPSFTGSVELMFRTYFPSNNEVCSCPFAFFCKLKFHQPGKDCPPIFCRVTYAETVELSGAPLPLTTFISRLFAGNATSHRV